MKFLATFCLLLVSVASFAQRTPYTFATLTNLVATDPRSYSGGGVASLLVLGRTTAGDWGRPKVWNYSASASSATNQWNVTPASGTGRLSTVETNDFLPLVAGSANPITGSLSLESPFTTNQAIRFKYPTYPANPPVGISAGLYGTGEHYLRFGSINTNTWNMLNSWLTIDGEAGNATFLGPVTIGGVTRTNWPSGAVGYASLTTNNTFTGSQSFTGPVSFYSDVTISDLILDSLTVSGGFTVPLLPYSTNWATTYKSNVVANGAMYDVIEQLKTNTIPGLIASSNVLSGITAGKQTNSPFGNSITFDDKGRATASEAADFDNDYSVTEEFVGPTTYSLFVGTANAGAAAAGTLAVTPTNIFGMVYMSTSGSNQYPQFLSSIPFKPSGFSSASIRARFNIVALETTDDPFDVQIGAFALGTTTNRPTAGCFLLTSASLGNANWWLCNTTNSSPSYVDTGVAASANTWADMTVKITPSNSIAYNGSTAVATNSSSHPGAGSFLAAWGARIARYKHTGGAVRFVYLDRFDVKFRSGRNIP